MVNGAIVSANTAAATIIDSSIFNQNEGGPTIGLVTSNLVMTNT